MKGRRQTDASQHRLAGPYALDALAEADRIGFERHLARCEDCASEVRSLREATAVLGSAVSAYPPAKLREQVLRAAARTRQYPPRQQRVAFGSPWRRLRASLPRVALATSALALAAAVVLGTVAITMQHRLDRAADRSSAVAAVLTARDATLMTAPVSTGGHATVVMSHEKRMMIFSAKDLHALPSAESYELWLMGPAGVRPAGLLPRPSHGMTTPVVVSGLAKGDEIGMTVEPGGGSPHPTSQPVLMIALPA